MRKLYVNGYIATDGTLTEAQKDQVIEGLYDLRKEYLYDQETEEFSTEVCIQATGETLPPGYQPQILVLSYDEKIDEENRKEIMEDFQTFLEESRAGNLDVEAVNAETIKDLTPDQLDAFVEYIRGRDGVFAVREKLERLNLI